MSANILLMGAGNIGSRHLQGLKKVKTPLSIEVIDPSPEALKIAEERYNQTESASTHKIRFLNDTNSIAKEIDLAIIATSSNIRSKITEQLVQVSKVRYIIFEKLLFQKKKDYAKIGNLLKTNNIKAWVNCSMRVTPFYAELKNRIKDKKINCIVSGSKYGFITNSIHFIDYLAYLNDLYDFEVETKFLDEKPFESKRKGFLEFNGTLNVSFKNGSIGSFVCYPDGEAPVVIEIINKDIRALANETDRSTWICESPEWKWRQLKETLAFQSDITGTVVTEILKSGDCNLTSYDKSSKLHLILLEELKKHLNNHSAKKYKFYPFT